MQNNKTPPESSKEFRQSFESNLAYLELSCEIIQCDNKEKFAQTALNHLSRTVKADYILITLEEGNISKVYSVRPDGSFKIAGKEKSPHCKFIMPCPSMVESCLSCYMVGNDGKPDAEWVRGFCVPLLEGSERVGSIMVVNHREHNTIEYDRQFVSVIANLFSAALTKLNLVEKMSVHLENQKRIALLSSQIVKNLRTENLLPAVVASAKTVIGTNACMLGLIDRKHQTITFPYIYNMPEMVRYMNIPLAQSVLATAAQLKKPILIEDYSVHEMAHPEFIQMGVKSILGLPIVIEGEVEGVLALIDLNHYRKFTPQDVDLAEIIAMQTTVALDNANLVNKLRLASMTDPLTGLYNREYYNYLVKQIESGNSDVYPLSMMVVDLDGLKLINDTQGHAKGDQIIQTAARTISEVMQGRGGITRMGGDEFTILLPNTSLKQAKEYREKILDSVTRLNRLSPGLNLSLSIGVACATDGTVSIKELYRSADHEMYLAKKNTSFSVRKNTIMALQAMMAELEPELVVRARWLEEIAGRFGQAVGLSERETYDFIAVALIHDIGKIGVNKNILRNKGPLGEGEFEEIKKHSEIGYRITITLDELANIAQHILYHHERWDGKGYPEGLKGEQIPRQSRMLALIDSYEAMTSDRPYRKALSHNQALQEIKAGAGSQFDPQLTEIFLHIITPPKNHE